MKSNSFKAFMGFFISFLILSSCTLLKDLDYTVTPSPLEMHGDSIKFSVTVNVPEKGISKSVKAEITPKLGNKALGVWTIQGEKIQGNGKTIVFKPGGTATFETSLAYDPSLEAADLVLTGKIYKGSKSKEKGELPSAKIADATIVTPLLARMTCEMCSQSDELVRVVDKSVSAVINYNKGKSLVKSKELKDNDIVDLVSWIAASQENEKLEIQSISIRGYASPDGEFAKNGDLSTERVESAAKAFSKLMTKAKLEAYTDIATYDQKGLGEDFEEFKKQLAATESISEGDKNLFIRVLEMEKDPEKREAEMVRLGKSYTQLEKDVFPNIRRAVITVNYKESGLTDEEMIAFATNNTDTLTVEEVLFTGETLLKDLNSRIALYAAVAEKMNDSRVYNNLGSLYYVQNDMPNAKANFEASANLNASGEVMNNLAAISMIEGDREKSRELFGKAKGMDADKMSAVKANSAGLDILDGAYSTAEGNISGNTFNKALAQMLQGDLSSAEVTLAESDDKNDADGLYLAAIMAARGGTGASDVVAKLKLAIAEDASFKAKAGKDREFVKFFEDAAFQALVK
jgi:outer membrane protein OmpA-like peptidoglycan-associated protein